MYHYLYKITNDFDECYYYGIHSTENLEDSYMGSGKRLWNAYKKHGIEHFTKEILEFFPDRESLSKRESEIVTETLIKDPNCYNIILGGDKCGSIGFVTARLIGTDKYELISVEEFYTNQYLYETPSSGHICVYRKDDLSIISITIEEFKKNRENYLTINQNKILVKDKDDNTFMVSVDDERLQTKELIPFWTNRKHKEETKQKMKKTFKTIDHQKGIKNSHYGTVWVTNGKDTKSISISELQSYLDQGWWKGRMYKDTSKMKKANSNRIWIHHNNETKFIQKSNITELKQLKKDGWLYGRSDNTQCKTNIQKENKKFFESL